jgi:hypothetical protein
MGAAVLALAAAAAWIAARTTRPDVRIQARLACALYAVMAAASLFEFARLPVTLTVTAVGPALLALADLTRRGFSPRPALSALLLAAAVLAGIVAAMTGLAVAAVAPQLLAVVAILSRGRAALYRALAALALLGAAASLLAPGRIAAVSVLLFSAAGLLAGAVALASGVDKRHEAKPRLAVGRLH